jgi:hypothetical protein
MADVSTISRTCVEPVCQQVAAAQSAWCWYHAKRRHWPEAGRRGHWIDSLPRHDDN